MQPIINFFYKIITNPKVEAFVIIGATSLLRKIFMDEEKKVEETIKASQPLHLPRGSVRALITVLLTLVLAGSFIMKYDVPQEFFGLTIFAIGYYVGYRTDNTQLPIIKQ